MSAVRSVFLVITARLAQIRLDLLFMPDPCECSFAAGLDCKTILFNPITVVCNFLSACVSLIC
jgi:hypothetical protein